MAQRLGRQPSLRSRALRHYERRQAARVESGTRLLLDSTRHFIPARAWLGGTGSDARANAEKRAEDLVRLNRGLLENMQVSAEVGRQRGEPCLRVHTVTRVGAMPEVLEFYRMAGDVDYMLRVVVQDMQAYDAFYKRLIAASPLKNVTSRFAMEKIKSTTSLPIP